ncbi:hypothetical protein B9479_007090 [Cryptococcus floricola]|uniref:N-acetyltransferase domain-containing protein n=1 Tax=Cryptococcus floricola TaxID=2591691 RepID=A0A5D3AN67_9TREE|nr:hypothetical protein B9479_007090 [Cryptococcus floricola]
MSVIRPFDPTDVLRFNNINQDPWTATYHNGYYATYALQWPDWCVSVEDAYDPSLKAYMIAKNEPPAPDPQHHGHLTALSITPSHRGLGLARVLMDILERLSAPGEMAGACDHGHGHDHDHGHEHAHEHEHHDHEGDCGHDHSHSHSHEQEEHHHEMIPINAGKDSVDAYFVDLFVRCNNKRATEMYEKMGYSVYRRVVDYYQGMEGVGSNRDELDGFDMRKSMPKDINNRYTRPNGRDILVSPDQVWS